MESYIIAFLLGWQAGQWFERLAGWRLRQRNRRGQNDEPGAW